MKSFASFHPFVLFIYYAIIIALTLFFMHPYVLFLSLVCSLLLFAILNPVRLVLREIGFYLLVFLLFAMSYPLFVHKGESILFYLNDNPVTREAIIYGSMIAVLLVAIAFWSKSYSEFMTSDKILYLFGKGLPKLSLMISIALRFIPTFKQQLRQVNQTQKTLGLYTSNSITDRVVSWTRTFRSVISWSVENAALTSDAMKARGYGLKGRTHFSLFKWFSRDVFLLLVMVALVGLVILLNGLEMLAFTYYPTLTPFEISETYVIHFIIILVLLMLPTLVELKENVQWNYFKSKI